MVTPAQIYDFVDRMVTKFHPEQVIVFGSYAYGVPSADSDVDLLVVRRHVGAGHELSTTIRMAVPRNFSMDLLVHSRTEIAKRIRMGDVFFSEIMTKGIVIYAAIDERVGKEGRERLQSRVVPSKVARCIPARSDLLPRATVRRKVSQSASH